MTTPSQPSPENMQLIGAELALRWPDGTEHYIPVEQLRAASPSAENVGESDLFGRIRGADPRTRFPGVAVEDWEVVGNYAIRFRFSDGHQTGLYSYAYLFQLGEELSGR